ncbi:hypothetical protein ACFX14_005354 [Malus domestica]
MGFRLFGSFSPPSPLSLSECKESRLCVLNFRSWEMEFLNPEGVELPPPPPPPMIPPHVVMLVAEEKPVELFTNTSTPKLIPMARPANGTKGAKDSDQPFQSGGEQVLWRERIAYCGGDQPFQNASPGRGSEHVGSEGDGTRVEKQFHSKTLKLQISFDSSSLEAVWVLDIILRQNVAKQFFLKSKQEQYGDGEEITCSEYFAVYKNLPVCESADFPCITVAKLKKLAYFPLELCTLIPLQRYTKTWHSSSPLIAIHLTNQGQDNECDCIRNLQRDGVEPLLINLCPSPANASTTMIVKHDHVLDLLTASQIDWMKANVQGHGQGGPMAIGVGGRVGGGTQLGPRRRRPIVYGQWRNGQKVRWMVEEARIAAWDDFCRTVQSVEEIAFRVVGTIEVNIHVHVRQLARKEILTLTELVNQIHLWGAVDGD